MLSHGCDALDSLCVAETASMAPDSEYGPFLDVRKSCMSLASQPFDDIPEETTRVARAAFPHSNRLMPRRAHLGTIDGPSAFEALYPQRGQPAEAPWRLARITGMPLAEDWTDRAAANAVRSRMDGKYALR